MLILPIMVVIGIVVENNLWLYIALGLAVLSQLMNVAKEQQQAKEAEASVKDLQTQLYEIMNKNIRSKNN